MLILAFAQDLLTAKPKTTIKTDLHHPYPLHIYLFTVLREKVIYCLIGSARLIKNVSYSPFTT